MSAAAPSRTFLAERSTDGAWRKVSYRTAEDEVLRLAAGLLGARAQLNRPIAILADNGIDHALLMRAVRKHTDCPWMLLYIERWLKAPAQLEDGTLVARDKRYVYVSRHVDQRLPEELIAGLLND